MDKLVASTECSFAYIFNPSTVDWVPAPDEGVSNPQITFVEAPNVFLENGKAFTKAIISGMIKDSATSGTGTIKVEIAGNSENVESGTALVLNDASGSGSTTLLIPSTPQTTMPATLQVKISNAGQTKVFAS